MTVTQRFVCGLAATASLLVVGSVAYAQYSPRVEAFVEDSAGQASVTVNVGTTLLWRLRIVAESSTSNLGLAGCAFEIRQQTGPAALNVAVPAVRDSAIAMLDRPLGFATLDPSGTASGFGGYAVANQFGGQDLVSIGGSMNTTGVALPSSAGIGTSSVVVPGLALAPSGQIIVSGTAATPLRVGFYTLGVGRSHVNVLSDIASEGSASGVLVAEVGTTPLSIVLFCQADFNGVGGLTVQDVFDFLAAFFAMDPRADFNGVGGVTVQDVFDFLTAWFTGCEF